jgi:hypothetical protein
MHFVLQRSEVPHSWSPQCERQEIENIVPVPRDVQSICKIEIYAHWDHSFIHHIRVLEIYFRVLEWIARISNFINIHQHTITLHQLC